MRACFPVLIFWPSGRTAALQLPYFIGYAQRPVLICFLPLPPGFCAVLYQFYRFLLLAAFCASKLYKSFARIWFRRGGHSGYNKHAPREAGPRATAPGVPNHRAYAKGNYPPGAQDKSPTTRRNKHEHQTRRLRPVRCYDAGCRCHWLRFQRFFFRCCLFRGRFRERSFFFRCCRPERHRRHRRFHQHGEGCVRSAGGFRREGA